MLSNEQKEILRDIHIYELTHEEKKGVPIITKNVPKTKNGITKYSTVVENFVIPNTYEIFETMSKKILDSGFSEVERVSPNDANCIIRIFQKLHYEYFYNYIFNLYGADCFVKDKKNWISHCSAGTFTLYYSKHIIRQWICQDESVYIDTDFVDFYVKVS